MRVLRSSPGFAGVGVDLALGIGVNTAIIQPRGCRKFSSKRRRMMIPTG